MGIAGFVFGVLLAAASGDRIVDRPCVAEPVFPDDCVERLGAIGGAVLDRNDEGFRNVVAPIVDPLLLLATASGDDPRLYALNPAADRVRVFDTSGNGLSVLRDIEVCRRPSALAQSVSGDEVFVACHGSAAVAVIDTATDRMVAVIQDRDDEGRPRLAEPMGMVATEDTLYVASSQNDRIAVVELGTRAVTGYIEVPGRDPRALVLAGEGRYLVAANFLAGNRTEPLVEAHPSVHDRETAVGAVCAPLLADADTAALADESSARFMDTSHDRYAEVAECYLFAQTFGSSKTIVRQPRRSDHDLVVVERATERVVFTTDVLDRDLGAVNYHLATDFAGRRLYVVSTQARNDLGHAFGERPIVNQLSVLDLDPKTGGLALAGVIDLDAAAPGAKRGAQARAPLPSAVTLHGGRLLIAAGGADTLLTASPAGDPRSSIPVGYGPRGVVARNQVAFVYNATGLSVSRVDLPAGRETAQVTLGPNPLTQRQRIGARLFNSARFSPNGSFACASCHPDGHQDGLVWEMNDRDGLRATLPVAGISETAPYHWDGSKCNLHDIIQDSVVDLFRNSRQLDPCELKTMIDYIGSLERPASPFRALDDTFSREALLGSAVVHRARFKDAEDRARSCSRRLEDPAVEAFYLKALGDPFGATLRFNGGGGPVPATRSSESCSLANCHVTPFGESEGFRNGDPEAGLIDGYQAVSTEGVWDRVSTQHDGRATRDGLLRALAVNRLHHGAPALTGAGGPAGVAAQAFNDANFRHPEFNFDDRRATHGFALTDAITRYMLEEQSPESAAVGLFVVVGRHKGDPEQARLLSALLYAAEQGKVALMGEGTVDGAPTQLTFRPRAGSFSDDAGTTYELDELRRAMSPDDVLVLRGALLPELPGGLRPKLIAALRETSPISCSENYALYPATVQTGEKDAALILHANGVAPGSRVLIDGRVRGPALDGDGPELAWTLPRAPDEPAILSLQVLSPEGLLSGSLPLPVVDPVIAAIEPTDLAADRDGTLTEFRWLDQFGFTGPGTRYDVFRGDLADLRTGGAATGECITPADWAQARITDGRIPESGAGLFYVVRAQNQLGVTSWGSPDRNRLFAASAEACDALFPPGPRDRPSGPVRGAMMTTR